MTIIAKFSFPKQRATRKYGFIILENYKDSYCNEFSYSVHRFYEDNGSMDSGSYDLTLEQAWNEFNSRIQHTALNYGPATWEEFKR
jgi:hypothetical protein